MSQPTIPFQDGAAYERMMGRWSRLAGETFLDWVQAPSGLNWVDVGCGNGAFTELIVERTAPASIQGFDPSQGQITFARTRHQAGVARFDIGDAMALPLGDASVDAAVMALVIFFVPEPSKGVAEMARVVKPGGLICAYAWDILGGGFPLEPIQAELRALGLTPTRPPHPEAATIEGLTALWRDAGLMDIHTREIITTRHFNDFEDFWASSMAGTAMSNVIGEMEPAMAAALKAKVRLRIGADTTGPVSYVARAHAVKGKRPL
ncbi:MAG: methyltransferase domain-containing protein [Alphaproteobacteria bacterium]